MRHLLVLTVLSSIAAAACASDPCSDGASATHAVANEIASCAASQSGYFGGFSPCFDQNACEANLKSCSTADRTALEATVACQNSYASNNDCSYAALSAYNDCAQKATFLADGGSALSLACAAAFAQNQGICAPPDAGA